MTSAKAYPKTGTVIPNGAKRSEESFGFVHGKIPRSFIARNDTLGHIKLYLQRSASFS